MSAVFDPSASLSDALNDSRSKKAGLRNGLVLLEAAQAEVHRRSSYAAAYFKNQLGSTQVLETVRTAFEEGVQQRFIENLCSSLLSSLTSDAGYQGAFPKNESSNLMEILLHSFDSLDLLADVRSKAYKKSTNPVDEFTTAVGNIDHLAKKAATSAVGQLSHAGLPGLLDAYRKMVDSAVGGVEHTQACRDIAHIRQEKLDAHTKRVNGQRFISPEENRIVTFRSKVFTDVLALSEKEMSVNRDATSEPQRLERDFVTLTASVHASASKL